MRILIRDNYDQVSQYVAEYVKDRILKWQPTPEKPFVLGLPTGSSPLGTYKKLIEYVKKGELSFKNVVTFNMDEYVNLKEDHPESYHAFMWDNFFKNTSISIPKMHIF